MQKRHWTKAVSEGTMSASVAQLVEQGIENSRVVGSIPTGGIRYGGNAVVEKRSEIGALRNADLAHLVERNLAKVEVAGSRPVIRLYVYSDVRTYIAFLRSERCDTAGSAAPTTACCLGRSCTNYIVV